MKTIVAIWNKAGKGKTDTIKEFTKLLLESFPSELPINTKTIKSKGDFCMIVEINGKKIGIESKGDPGTGLYERLSNLISHNCDLIICSTRTSGETANSVIDLGKTNHYQIIWSSTYEIEDTTQHSKMNYLKGKHLLDLILSLNILEFNKSKIHLC
ncbi:hypothetical protein SAMN05216490_3252 [Mucilaginibacter mallensis]|uniref:Uncharacterized protein n=1 Tax=Mucilaginibacter mallensis TaxID=652787 RepID=A0A1H1ZV54_MUCMA|nr:hypothetical protein [Mucilaginibacter mallensis]SDT37262.1 hypothetical protein SAMN05216490_3252 [Mucilaginibacter mallensis]